MTDQADNYLIPIFCIFILIDVQHKELYVLKPENISFLWFNEMLIKVYHVFGHKENSR